MDNCIFNVSYAVNLSYSTVALLNISSLKDLVVVPFSLSVSIFNETSSRGIRADVPMYSVVIDYFYPHTHEWLWSGFRPVTEKSSIVIF